MLKDNYNFTYFLGGFETWSLQIKGTTQTEGVRIFGPKREKVLGG
jgi:hypothetical protein